MNLDQQWRDFICEPGTPGRYLTNIGRSSTAAVAADIGQPVLSEFLSKLAGGGADVELLADAVDLSSRDYSEFGSLHLRGLLDALSNERVGEEVVVGPVLRGNPRWDRTMLARSTRRIPSSHYVSRLPERSFALPENALVRWLVGSLADGVDSLERRVGSKALPPRLIALRDNCRNALTHQWFRLVVPPQRPTQAMLSAAKRQRVRGYRIAAELAARRATRVSGGREARWLRTLDLLRANWLSPERTDDLFELYALTLVLDVLEIEFGLGRPVEYGLAIPGRAHVAAFEKDESRVFVFFDQSPQRTLKAPSRYSSIVSAHLAVRGAARRPDVTIVRYVPEHGPIAVLVEVKETRDSGYTADSIYKALGYVRDFSTLWDIGNSGPKVVLLLPEDVTPRPEAQLTDLDVVLISSLDRSALVRALSSRLNLPFTDRAQIDVGKA